MGVNTLDKFLAFVVAVLLTIPIALLRGVVLADMIDWFTPYRVSVVQAVGLSLIVAVFTISLSREKCRSLADLFGRILSNMLTLLLLWLFAYLWSLFL